MKYKQPALLLLFSLLALLGYNYKAVIAQPLLQIMPNRPQTAPVGLPPKLSSNDLTAPLTSKLETYTSQAMGSKRSYSISLPPGYGQNPYQRYPVIFLLHGGHGDATSWFDPKKGAALVTIRKLYAQDKVPPSIIIAPDGNDERGTSPYWDPQYIDGPHGKVVTALGKELVKVIQTRYRTLPAPDFWAIGGLSSGGWGAMNVGLHNLQNFKILFSHSGYFRDKSGPQNSPISYIKTLSPLAQRHLEIYLDTGISDTEELVEAKRFSQVLSNLKIDSTFHQYPGNHTWQYWRDHLSDSLTFVGKEFQVSQLAHARDPINSNKQTATQINQNTEASRF